MAFYTSTLMAVLLQARPLAISLTLTYYAKRRIHPWTFELIVQTYAYEIPSNYVVSC